MSSQTVALMGTVYPKWNIHISPLHCSSCPGNISVRGGIKDVFLNRTKPVKIPLWIKDGLMEAPPLAEKQWLLGKGASFFFEGVTTGRLPVL